MTVVQLAVNSHSGPDDNALLAADAPTVRLATGHGNEGDNALLAADAPTVYLAHVDTAQGSNALRGTGEGELSARGLPLIARDKAPPILISYVYVERFLAAQARYRYRDWALDSGAFSAWNIGQRIDLDDYTALCKDRLAEDPTLAEVFALDVIGDWRGTLRNVEAMWKAGVPAIPTYHVGEPEEALLAMARDYPKIALGGMVGVSQKLKREFSDQCFARVWPKKVHGFGVGHRELILHVPWHSVDATNWQGGPCRFGRWNTYGQMSVRGSHQDLRVEIEYYRRVEEEARLRWKKEMRELE